MDMYEKQFYDRLKLVINSALINADFNKDIHISTGGLNPKCSISIPAYVFNKFIRDEK